jgi:hypothetical protein
LAIVDVLLQQGSGLNLIRRFKQQPGAGYVVVFSGFIAEVIKQHFLSVQTPSFKKVNPARWPHTWSAFPGRRR